MQKRCKRPYPHRKCQPETASVTIDKDAAYREHNSITDKEPGIYKSVFYIGDVKVFLDSYDGYGKHLAIEKA